MKKIDLGQTITTLANVGVIAGIIFLAFELRQNNQLLEAQARADRRDIAREAGLRQIGNAELRSVTVKALNGQALSDDERYLLDLENQAVLTDWMYIHQEVQFGLLEESAIPAFSWQSGFYERRPKLPEYWSANKDARFPPDFVQWMDENIVNER